MVISGLGILSAQAQGGAFGAKATPMLSWAKTVNNDSYNFESEGVVPSIGFGPSFKKYFGENFNVDVSLLFTWQKSKFTATPVTQFGNPKSYSVLTKLQYVQIPVIFEASFPITGGLRGMIDFGASPAIELNSMADISDISDESMETKLEDSSLN